MPIFPSTDPVPEPDPEQEEEKEGDRLPVFDCQPQRPPKLSDLLSRDAATPLPFDRLPHRRYS